MLITADYLGSQERQVSIVPAPEQLIFANTICNQLADTLTEHLRKVAKNTSRLFSELDDWPERIPSFTSLDTDELPASLCPRTYRDRQSEGKTRRYTDKRYKWQHDAVIALTRIKAQADDAIRRDECDHFGFFGVLVAGTGSGKTRAAPRILAAVTDDNRWTTALGYRSLTTQTHQEYVDKERIGLPESTVACLVGLSAERLLAEQDGNTDESDPEGIGNRDNDIPEYAYEFLDDDLIPSHPLTGLGNRSLKPLLEKPVVVCTTDHIVHACQAARGGQTLPLFRVTTSDLILDELDCYNSSDWIALGKWIYVSGLFGRKVLLVSATLPDVLVTRFANLYFAGLRAYQLRTGQRCSIIAAAVSDLSGQMHAQIYPIDKQKLFNADYHQQFLKPLHDQIIQSAHVKPRRRYQFLEAGVDNESLIAHILNETIPKLHLAHRNSLTIDGVERQVSIGVVMWDTVPQAQAFAAAAATAEVHKLTTCVCCYHSRYTILDRMLLENLLGELLNRKEDWQSRWTHIPELQRLWTTTEGDICIIVAATNIVETGRDFDFDWAVADLFSIRSLIQLAGRILRHRLVKTSSPNLILFNKPQLHNRRHHKKDAANPERLGQPFQSDKGKDSNIIHNAPALLLQDYKTNSSLIEAELDSQNSDFWQPFKQWVGCGTHTLSNHPKHRFRNSTQSYYLVNQNFNNYPVWENGKYSQACSKWYQVDKPRLELRPRDIQGNPIGIPITTASGHWLLSSQDRQRRCDELGLDHLPASFLHALQIAKYNIKLQNCSYSSEKGFLMPVSI